MKKIKMCPRCGSSELKSSLLLSAYEIAKIEPYKTVQNMESFLCLECNYFGPCLEINPKDIKKYKNKLKVNIKNSYTSLDYTRRKTFAKVEIAGLILIILIGIISLILRSLTFWGFATFILLVVYFIGWFLIFEKKHKKQ